MSLAGSSSKPRFGLIFHLLPGGPQTIVYWDFAEEIEHGGVREGGIRLAGTGRVVD